MACLAIAGTAQAQQVVLESPDKAIRVQGQLLSHSDISYVVQTAIGVMEVQKASVGCTGDGCPQATVDGADLVVRGSDTIGEELLPLLVEGYANSMEAGVRDRSEVGEDTSRLKIHEEFGAGETMMSVDVQAAGSSTGFRSLLAGEADIAMSSRPARADELRAAREAGLGNLTDLDQEYIIAVDSILTIVSPDNPVNELSVGQMADIFSGRVSNWSEIGGPNLPVTVFTRPEASGTRGVFATQILSPANAQMSADAVVVGSNAEMADRVTETAGGIGYVGFASVRGAKPVDLIASCGIRMPATEFSAKTEEYPLERRLRLYVDNRPGSEHRRNLLNFAISTEAEGLVRKAGFIDLGVVRNPDPLQAERLIDAATEANDPFALSALRDMLVDLNGASRLSTTFRFASGSAALDNKAVRDLGRMIAFLGREENAGSEVLVVGFTDADGAFSANDALSEARAAVVLQALLDHPDAGKLANVRLRSTGYGELSPVGCNTDFLGKKRNRRVEVWIR
ncbi:MAG: phosphate ABC transporter substrate-binding/OmpA family protein [Pseudomonadota bacterium]